MTGFYATAGHNSPTIIIFHGLSGGLDTSFVFKFLEARALSGVNILTVATSAHGNIAMSQRGDPPQNYLGGSAFEEFDECLSDIEAWVDFSDKKSSGAIFLMGHSLGAAKVARYTAITHDARVKGVVLASAADLKGAFWERYGAEMATTFLKVAEDMVDAGAGRRLMDEKCVVGLLKQRISAATFLDRFADDQPSDMFDFYERGSQTAFVDLERIAVPILALYGSVGEIVGGGNVENAVALLKRHAPQSPSFDSLIVPANHWYVGQEAKVAERLGSWIATNCASSSGAQTTFPNRSSHSDQARLASLVRSNDLGGNS